MIFHGHEESAAGAASASKTVNVPAGVQDGFLLIAVVFADSPITTFGPETGWSAFALGGQSSAFVVAAYQRPAASEPASYTFTPTAGLIDRAHIIAFDPEGETPQVDDFAFVFDDSAADAVIASTAVTVEAGGLLFAMFFDDSLATIATPPAGMTDIGTNPHNASGMSAALYHEATSGSQSRSITWSAAEQLAALVFAVSAPAAGGSGPTITDEPDNIAVDDGEPAVFAVAATGVGTLTYQWQRDTGGGFANLSDGGAISGATTDELTIDPTTLAMHGDQFRCVVTDDDGSANSAAATLSVNGADVLTQPATVTDSAGEAAGAFSSAVTPTAPATYEIRRITATIDGTAVSAPTFVFVEA